MKRRVRVIAVFLLLGFVVNLIVSGLCDYGEQLLWRVASVNPTFDRQSRAARRLWDRDAPVGWGNANHFVTQHGPLLTAHQAAFIVEGPTSPASIRSILEWQVGWPLRCLRGQLLENGGVKETKRYWLHGSPAGVMWAPLLFNSLFYSGVVALLWFSARGMRRRSRLGRDRCPACAYIIGTSPICSECGHELSPPVQSPHGDPR